MTNKLILVLTAVMVLMACDSGADPDSAELPGDPVCIEEIDAVGEEYLGLSEAEALDLAAEQALDPREVGRDGECFAITMDLRDDRINLEYIDDVVVGAAVF